MGKRGDRTQRDNGPENTDWGVGVARREETRGGENPLTSLNSISGFILLSCQSCPLAELMQKQIDTRTLILLYSPCGLASWGMQQDEEWWRIKLWALTEAIQHTFKPQAPFILCFTFCSWCSIVPGLWPSSPSLNLKLNHGSGEWLDLLIVFLVIALAGDVCLTHIYFYLF